MQVPGSGDWDMYGPFGGHTSEVAFLSFVPFHPFHNIIAKVIGPKTKFGISLLPMSDSKLPFFFFF
jgi:hypothetical protein